MTTTEEEKSDVVLFRYIKDSPLYLVEKPYSVVPTKALNEDTSNIVYQPHNVSSMLEDVRGREEEFDLHETSFAWIKHASEIPVTTEEAMMVPYAKEVNNILRDIFKTDDVICYDLRWRRNTSFTGEETISNRRTIPSPPIRIVHIDHTPEGGWNRIRRHLSPEEIKKYCTGAYRARIVNIWRPLFRSIQDNPIAFCDPSTVSPDDLMKVDRVTPISLVEIFELKYNSMQKWYWLQGQRPDEPVVFVQFDSHCPDGTINVPPHTTFTDPNAPSNGQPRESIETRSIVFTKLDTKGG